MATEKRDTPPRTETPSPDKADKADEKRKHEEECLDESLKETFPASDPIAPQSPEKHP